MAPSHSALSRFILCGTLTASAAALNGCTAPTPSSTTSTANMYPAHDPGLSVGSRAPDAIVTAIDGKPVHLSALYADGPIVLTFYRGGWCPICNRALAAWHDKLDALQAAGGTLVALTPEKPELASDTREKAGGGYSVYSDARHDASRAFNIDFVVDDATQVKYGEYGLKVAEANVSGTWELPAPATFVIDRDGVIRWSFADWDYKKRADPDTVIAAVRAISTRSSD